MDFFASEQNKRLIIARDLFREIDRAETEEYPYCAPEVVEHNITTQWTKDHEELCSAVERAKLHHAQDPATIQMLQRACTPSMSLRPLETISLIKRTEVRSELLKQGWTIDMFRWAFDIDFNILALIAAFSITKFNDVLTWRLVCRTWGWIATQDVVFATVSKPPVRVLTKRWESRGTLLAKLFPSSQLANWKSKQNEYTPLSLSPMISEAEMEALCNYPNLHCKTLKEWLHVRSVALAGFWRATYYLCINAGEQYSCIFGCQQYGDTLKPYSTAHMKQLHNACMIKFWFGLNQRWLRAILAWLVRVLNNREYRAYVSGPYSDKMTLLLDTMTCNFGANWSDVPYDLCTYVRWQSFKYGVDGSPFKDLMAKLSKPLVMCPKHDGNYLHDCLSSHMTADDTILGGTDQFYVQLPCLSRKTSHCIHRTHWALPPVEDRYWVNDKWVVPNTSTFFAHIKPIVSRRLKYDCLPLLLAQELLEKELADIIGELFGGARKKFWSMLQTLLIVPDGDTTIDLATPMINRIARRLSPKTKHISWDCLPGKRIEDLEQERPPGYFRNLYRQVMDYVAMNIQQTKKQAVAREFIKMQSKIHAGRNPKVKGTSSSSPQQRRGLLNTNSPNKKKKTDVEERVQDVINLVCEEHLEEPEEQDQYINEDLADLWCSEMQDDYVWSDLADQDMMSILD